MKVTIRIESYELGDVTVTKEDDDSGSPKQDQELIGELVTDAVAAVRRAYDFPPY